MDSDARFNAFHEMETGILVFNEPNDLHHCVYLCVEALY